MEAALAATRAAGIALRPTWVAFTPWTTLTDYVEMLDWVAAHGLVDHVDPVQYSLRLLVPPGSLLVDHPGMRPHLGALVAADFSYDWRHPDPRMEALQAGVAALLAESAPRGRGSRRHLRPRARPGRDGGRRSPPRPSWRRAWPPTGGARPASPSRGSAERSRPRASWPLPDIRVQ